jgi:transcription elongation factor Elf1
VEHEGLNSVTKIYIKTKDVSSLIGKLAELPKLEWSKVWSIDLRTIGIFTFEFSYGEHIGAVNVVVEHNSKSNEGFVWIESYGSAYSPTASGARRLLETVGHTILSEKGHFEVLKTVYKGEKCPHCEAVYKYLDSVRADDGSLVCQNCGKDFRPELPTREEAISRAEPLENVSCPFCSVSYVYKARHIQEDGTVDCQNCGMNFPLEIDDTIKYSHRFYAEDNS